MLELKNVSKAYGKKTVIQQFGYRFLPSETYAVLGASGCGKTTLLRLMAGIERPDSGEILVSPKAKVSMVFQEDRLLNSLDARGNVLAVLGNRSNNRAIADECLSRCGLLSVADSDLSELSGGMKRRVAIARAIAFHGDILLLDEPFKGLDNETKKKICDFVFNKNYERITIFITHDEEEASAYATKILRFEGPPLTPLEREGAL